MMDTREVSSLAFLNKNTMDSDDSEIAERDPSGRYVRGSKVLGKGAFKTVYIAFDEVNGMEVAWNQVRLNEVLRSPEQLEMLYSEVHLLKSLKHENIVKCYYWWVDDVNHTINMITELLTSGNLRQYRQKHKHVDLKAIKRWARQILSGLQYLHSHDPPIIHRDLKCDNIFVNGNTGQVKVGDLGLAVVMHRPTACSVIGTPEFMAPELYEENYDELVDVYSFGMCMLEMFTCELPYMECKNPAQIYKKVTSGKKPASLSKVTDPQLRQFIEKCLVPASMRLSAAELLKDPFLSPASNSGLASFSQVPSSENIEAPVATDLHSMDIDVKKKSSVEYSLSKVEPLVTMTSEITRSNNANTFRMKGEISDDCSILISVRMVDMLHGQVKNIHFPFYLQNDTTHSIAGEMVNELDLPNEDAVFIAQMMDDLIREVTNGTKAARESVTPGESVEPTQVLAPWEKEWGAQDSLVSCMSAEYGPVASHEQRCCAILTSSESSTCGRVEESGLSNMSSLTLAPKDEDEELKMELNAIDVQYHQRMAELLRMRQEAIEDVKRKWSARKNSVA